MPDNEQPIRARLSGEPLNPLDPLRLPEEEPGWDYGGLIPLARRTGEDTGNWSVPEGSLRPAIPGMVRHGWNDLLGLVEGPIKALRSGEAPANIPPEQLLALSGLGVGAGLQAPRGALGMFAGQGAKGAPLSSLERAKAMAEGSERHSAVFHPETGQTIQVFPSEIQAKGWVEGPAGQNYQKQTGKALDYGPVTEKDIWHQTGWYKAPDGRWRFEVPDSEAAWGPKAEKLKSDFMGKKGEWINFPLFQDPPKLGDVLHHPKLFAAYPELADVPVHSTGMGAGFSGVKGGFTDKGSIALTGGKPGEVLSTLLHEIQHWVQGREGFARGGNMGEFLPKDFAERFKASEMRIDDLTDKIREAGANPVTLKHAMQRGAQGKELYPYEVENIQKVPSDLLTRWADALDAHSPLLQEQHEAFKKYQSLHGEQEARNVQARHEHGSYDVAPFETPGYPTENPLIRFDQPGGAGAAEAFTGYHGSPASRFDPEPGHPLGRFKDEFIGSGEGAQAFGYGHYVSGNPRVAGNYRDTLARGQPGELTFDGQPINRQVLRSHFGDGNPAAAEALNHVIAAQGDISAAARKIQQNIDASQKIIETSRAMGIQGHLGQYETQLARKQDELAWLMKNRDRIRSEPPGQLLEVRARPEEHELLDWDKKLSEQSPHVQERLKKLPEDLQDRLGEHAENHGHNSPLEAPEDYTGGEFYKSASHHNVVDHEAELSEALHKAGIPGIRYLDQGSRGLKPVAEIEKEIEHVRNVMHDSERHAKELGYDFSDGYKRELMRLEKELERSRNPTHNYVIFDPSNLVITARNGQRLHPVNHDPWAQAAKAAGHELQPVEHNPFEKGKPKP